MSPAFLLRECKDSNFGDKILKRRFMEKRYFKRDISWLSFNQRVLMEAADESLPVYERLNFVAIYSSNLEEFYKIRVADHKAVASGITRDDEESVQSAVELVEQINDEVSRQMKERIHIYEQKLVPALRRHHIVFCQSPREVLPCHYDFVRRFFLDEIFPYLAPVPADRQRVVSFLRDNRLYLAVRLYKKGVPPVAPGGTEYFVMKLPYSKVPRFIELPKVGADYYLMYIEDIIKANLDVVFPGYDVDCSYCIKTSRDADVLIDDVPDAGALIEQLKKKVKKRKTGAVCRFVYERDMPPDFLRHLMNTYRIDPGELVPEAGHLNLEDLGHLPNPNPALRPMRKPQPMKLSCLDEQESVFRYVEHKDLLVHYPYQSFEHFLHFLSEAVHDPGVSEILLTQYRVAENSAVVGHLVAAARNGKRVTVFVELKARFDEEHNLATATMMQAAGVRIIYSMPGLKVHAKVALVTRRRQAGMPRGYAYVSTGNFNEKTARLYADCALFTCRAGIVDDLKRLFKVLRGQVRPEEGGKVLFRHLLVTRFNLIPRLDELIGREMELARSGRGGRIVLKMNALQDTAMIERLYAASQAGVQVELIVRGICCLVPGEAFSRNIRVTRIVDTFLEHARIWYFEGGGRPSVFLGSPDWMRRNLYRRIEAVVPVLDPDLQRELTDMLRLQLADRRKGCFVDARLRNVFKSAHPSKEPVRAQYAFYDYLRQKAHAPVL